MAKGKLDEEFSKKKSGLSSILNHHQSNIHSEDQNDILGESSPTKEGLRDEELNNQEKKGQEIRLYHSGTAN